MENEERDVKKWIMNIIESCTHTVHLTYTQVLVDLYKDKCENESDAIEIQDCINQKYNHIHSIIK